MTSNSYKTILTVVVAAVIGALSAVVLQGALATRATSSDSHAVWNYIVEANVTEEMQERFNKVNGDFPPKKADLAMLLLEARTTATAKLSSK